MRNLFLIVLNVAFLLIFSCDEQSTQNEPNDQSTGETLYWLSFKVTCLKNNQYNPVFCNIEIFRNEVSIENGSTSIRDGWYASSKPYYRSTDKARIIFKDFASGEILTEIFNITPNSDMIWFVDSAEKRRTNNPSHSGSGHLHLGSCN
jgi:hypothetical protein